MRCGRTCVSPIGRGHSRREVTGTEGYRIPCAGAGTLILLSSALTRLSIHMMPSLRRSLPFPVPSGLPPGCAG
jgi:hypothetical protein